MSKADDNSETEAQLRKLGERIREGWGKLPRVTEEQKDQVRKSVREQWEKEHSAKEKSALEEQGQKKQAKKEHKKSMEDNSTQSKQAQSDSDDHGHSH